MNILLTIGVQLKSSTDLDRGRRPELKSDEFFECTPISSRDNLTFVSETAEKSGAVIGGATPCAAYESSRRVRSTHRG